MSGRRTRAARSPTSRSTTKVLDPVYRLYALPAPAPVSGAGVLHFAPLRRAESCYHRAILLNGDPMTEIHDLSAGELLKGYRAKTLSPSEVCVDVEQHIAPWEPHIKALYAYDPNNARKEAAASTQRWAKGAAVGPLDGVPVTVKENIARSED